MYYGTYQNKRIAVVKIRCTRVKKNKIAVVIFSGKKNKIQIRHTTGNPSKARETEDARD